MSREKFGVVLWTGIVWLRTGSSDSLCEHGDGSSGHMQSREFHTSFVEEYGGDEKEGKCNVLVELKC
jgi:hypothetical protein